MAQSQMEPLIHPKSSRVQGLDKGYVWDSAHVDMSEHKPLPPNHCYQLAVPNTPNQKNLRYVHLRSQAAKSAAFSIQTAAQSQVNLSSAAGGFSVLMDCEPGRGDNGGTCKPEPPPTDPNEDGESSKIIAFTAKLNICDSYPEHDGVLKFADVLVNRGDGYSPATGVFTCPRAGVYSFATHMSTYGRAQCAVFRNGVSVVSMYHTTLPDKCSQMASVSCVLQLEANDTVWVNLWGEGRHDIFASKDNDTVFVGFRLG